MEYLAVGEPLLQAFQAEHHASPGQIIVSEVRATAELLNGITKQTDSNTRSLQPTHRKRGNA